LGRAFVEALAGKGMRVAVHYGASADEAAVLVRELAAGGHEAESFGADLRDADAAAALPDRVAARFGQLDVLINSAAVMERVSVADATAQHWNDVINLNLRAPFF